MIDPDVTEVTEKDFIYTLIDSAAGRFAVQANKLIVSTKICSQDRYHF